MAEKCSERCVIDKLGPCVVVRLVSENKENRLNPEFLQEYNKALDQVESYEDVTCMVTISEGKFFSLGLDLEVFLRASLLELNQYLTNLQNLYCRLLTFPLVTVAAVNGHIYAGGALLGLCHDYIIMNSRKGFFCFSEVKLKVNFPAGLLELAKARLQQRVHKAVLVLGRRYTGIEAEAAGIVDELCPPAQLRDTAIAAAGRLAGSEGLDRKTLSTLKRDLYRDVVLALSEPPRHYSRL